MHKIQGGSHATILVEMRDQIRFAIQGPLDEARAAPVIKSIKERFPGKPIRYAIPTHHHLDHAGGIRAFMAESAAIVVPFNAQAFYSKVARAPHTRNPYKSGSLSEAPLSSKRSAAATESSATARARSRYIRSRRPTQKIWLWYVPPRHDFLSKPTTSALATVKLRLGSRVKEFVRELDKLNLDVATIVGIHGDQASLEATRAAAKK